MLSTIEKMVRLREARLLRGLTTEEMFMIGSIAAEVELSPGETLFNEGEPGEQMFVIVNGTVEVTLGSGDARRRLATLGRGDVLGEMAIFCGETRSATVSAGAEPVLLLCFDGTAITELITEHPTIALAFLREMARRAIEANQAALPRQ